MNRSTPRKNGERSPLRQSLQDSRRSLRHGHPSPSRDAADSPSRQLLHEFHRLLIDKEQHLQDDLDEQIEKQAELHRAALAFAASEHERVRKNAEIARERVELEIERERKRREQEEKDRLEKERQAKVAREADERRRQRELLERQQREDAAKAAEERELQERRSRIEEQTKKEAEEAARKKQEADDAAKQRAKEAAANAAKAREEAQKAVPQVAPAVPPTAAVSTPAAQAPQSAAQPVQSTTGQSDSLQQEFEHVHKQYLHMHKKLKEMREHVITESKKIPALKTKLGDWRREIVKCMGQLTADKTKNRKPMAQISAVLQESLKFTTPSVDVSSYLISVPNPASGQPILMPGVLVYLLNIFAKSIVTQFISETSGGAKTADPVGVVAVSIFANPAFKIGQSIPLIDLLLAKYHVVCPPLFCINGPQTTAPGRLRIGWWREGNSFVPEQRHLERMAGLATGWAALTLRDFSRSKNDNPLPNWYYWRAIASVASTKTGDVGSTHASILKGLIDGFVPRFIGFYGNMAKAVLREALVGMPERLRRERKNNPALQAAGTLEVLREVLQRDSKLSLA